MDGVIVLTLLAFSCFCLVFTVYLIEKVEDRVNKLEDKINK